MAIEELPLMIVYSKTFFIELGCPDVKRVHIHTSVKGSRNQGLKLTVASSKFAT